MEKGDNHFVVKSPNEVRDIIRREIIKEFGGAPRGAEGSQVHIAITATINQIVKMIADMEFNE